MGLLDIWAAQTDNYTIKYVNADYSFYCDTIVDLYMQAYELIRSV